MGEGIHFSFIRVMKPKCIRTNFFIDLVPQKTFSWLLKLILFLLLKDHLKRKRFFYDLLWKVLQKGLLYIKASWPILKCWENVGIENQYSMGHQGKYPVYPVLPTVNNKI